MFTLVLLLMLVLALKDSVALGEGRELQDGELKAIAQGVSSIDMGF